MNKSIIIIFLFILGTSNILIKSKNTKVTYNKNEIISASYVIPEDLEELDENAPIILKGSFTGNRKIDEDTNIVGPSTISEFKVDKVYKGSIENDIISVLEPFEIKDNKITFKNVVKEFGPELSSYTFDLGGISASKKDGKLNRFVLSKVEKSMTFKVLQSNGKYKENLAEIKIVEFNFIPKNKIEYEKISNLNQIFVEL